ncbi:MAG: hypothetical protein AAF799_07110 [Myxococcota bacterium]
MSEQDTLNFLVELGSNSEKLRAFRDDPSSVLADAGLAAGDDAEHRQVLVTHGQDEHRHLVVAYADGEHRQVLVTHGQDEHRHMVITYAGDEHRQILATHGQDEHRQILFTHDPNDHRQLVIAY